MPTVDASQFTRFRKVNAFLCGDTQKSDPKSVNRLSSHNTRLTETCNLKNFLPTPSEKSAQPLKL